MSIHPYAIYGLTDPRETDDIKRVRYVGKGPPLIRYRCHISCARREVRRHCYNWLRNVLAADLLPGQRILEWTTARDGSEREQVWIRSLREQGADLTNGTDGGEGTPGLVFSPQHHAKLCAARVGRKPYLGHHHSEEAKFKCGAGNRGNKFSVDHCQKISAARMGQKNFLGHHHSDEAKLKCSKAHLGKKFSVKHCAKLSTSGMGNRNALGCHRSEETKLKLSAANKGRVPWNKGKKASPEAIAKLMGNKNSLGYHHSEKAKQKISAARLAYWARKKAILMEPPI